MENNVSINENQKLFVIPCGKSGYSCLGFDALERRMVALARELASRGHSIPQPAVFGTLERYQQYLDFIEVAKIDHAATGWRSNSELNPQLIGLEGWRIEVEENSGDKRRFIVGKSTGITPCHLELSRRNSLGGGSVGVAPFKSIRKIEQVFNR